VGNIRKAAKTSTGCITSVCELFSHTTTRLIIARFFYGLLNLYIFRKSVMKFQVLLRSRKKQKSTLHEYQHTFFVISRSVLLRMRYLKLQTNSEYVTLIAFPLQQRLREHVSMLRYTHRASLIPHYPIKGTIFVGVGECMSTENKVFWLILKWVHLIHYSANCNNLMSDDRKDRLYLRLGWMFASDTNDV
jgi:hypothetical protein